MATQRLTITVLAVCLVIAAQQLIAQTGSSRPPLSVSGAGGFTARRLTKPPIIDEKTWTTVEVAFGDLSTAVVPADLSYVLTFADPEENTGDFERYELMFKRGAAAAVRIDDNFTGWTYVSPDGRYVFMEPLSVLDVASWRKYALSEVFGITNYTSIEAISRDGKRLLISRVECAMDCPGQPVQYFELGLP
jgi:hypothetical protein